MTDKDYAIDKVELVILMVVCLIIGIAIGMGINNLIPGSDHQSAIKWQCAKEYADFTSAEIDAISACANGEQSVESPTAILSSDKSNVSLAISNYTGPILSVAGSNQTEIWRIDHNGSFYWHGRAVANASDIADKMSLFLTNQTEFCKKEYNQTEDDNPERVAPESYEGCYCLIDDISQGEKITLLQPIVNGSCVFTFVQLFPKSEHYEPYIGENVTIQKLCPY